MEFLKYRLAICTQQRKGCNSEQTKLLDLTVVPFIPDRCE
ncbi:hypothetical protein S7335_3375 [Synechococcus sp. PCC 7335]|nr:hypothetical protein S7335_3375 [Synechococcus sp. PCC 7335]